MKSKLIHVFLAIVAALTCVAVGWVVFYSTGSGEPDDHGIEAGFQPVADAENLYIALLPIEEQAMTTDESDALRATRMGVLNGDLSDRAQLDRMLEQHGAQLRQLSQAIQRPQFQSGPMAWGSEAVQPDYRAYQSLHDLLLLQATVHLADGRADQATGALMLSIRFADLLRHDQNGTLIAWLVGHLMLQSSLHWIEHAIQRDTLTDTQLVMLETALAGLPGYPGDGFRKALHGEYMTTKALIALVKEGVRDEHQRQAESGGDDNDRSLFESLGSQVSSVQSWLLAMGLYNYLLQPERTLQQRADQIQQLALASELPCKRQQFNDRAAERSAWDFIKPGGMLKDLLWTEDETYRRHFERRCLLQTQIESVRALIALQRHRLATGELPVNLRQLIPAYLNQLPRDWFDGRPLAYDSANAWVYSVGLDYQDAGGSKAAVLAEDCHLDANCINEPTFSLRRQTQPGS